MESSIIQSNSNETRKIERFFFETFSLPSINYLVFCSDALGPGICWSFCTRVCVSVCVFVMYGQI